jgi:hypothetical protein
MRSGDFSWGRAGLFNLFAAFLIVGEPAPTANCEWCNISVRSVFWAAVSCLFAEVLGD